MRNVLAVLILAAVGVLPAAAADRPAGRIRIATFNCSLNRASPGALRHDLATPDNTQAKTVAEIIQRVRPDILLLQEFDYDAGGVALHDFQTNYLGRPQNGAAAICHSRMRTKFILSALCPGPIAQTMKALRPHSNSA